MDLFIIIAAVLAAGGVVAAAVSGLIGSATSNSTIEVTSASLTGSSSVSNPWVLTMTVKNVGTSTLTFATSNAIALTITAIGGTSPTCSPTFTVSAGGTWTMSACSATGTSVTFSPGTQFTIPPGGQLAFSASVTESTGSSPITSGTSYTATVSVGSTTTSVKLNAQ